MAPIRNAALIFTKIPIAGKLPEPGVHYKYVQDRTIDLDTADMQGGIIVKNIAVPLEPYMKYRLRAPKIQGFTTPYEIGKPMTSLAVGQVVRSSNSTFRKGQFVSAEIGYEEYTILPSSKLRLVYTYTDEQIRLGLDTTTWVGTAGLAGMAAYLGLSRIAKLQPGDTIFISGASSAVGQVVGQIAKKLGCTVIGSTTSDEKIEFLKSLGFDHAFNYKNGRIAKEIAPFAPINVYWDHFGGFQLNIALAFAANHARFVICGMVSGLASKLQRETPNFPMIVTKRIAMEGFVILDYVYDMDFVQEFYETVPPMIASGDIKIKEDVRIGLESGLQGLVDCFTGANFGKIILKIGNPI